MFLVFEFRVLVQEHCWSPLGSVHFLDPFTGSGYVEGVSGVCRFCGCFSRVCKVDRESFRLLFHYPNVIPIYIPL